MGYREFVEMFDGGVVPVAGALFIGCLGLLVVPYWVG